MPTEEFATFARALLTDPGVRKAFTKRWKRGEFSAAELKMMTDAAQHAPESTDRQRAYAEERERLDRLSRGERKLLYILTKRMAGEPVESSVKGYCWRLARVPGGSADENFPQATVVYERPDEPELSEVLPLAEASRRLSALPEATVIATPEQALRALPEALREVKETRIVHDVDDEQHRAVCRACRSAWRARG